MVAFWGKNKSYDFDALFGIRFRELFESGIFKIFTPERKAIYHLENAYLSCLSESSVVADHISI